MSREKIKELIHELQKPGAKKDEILTEIVQLKRKLGDKVKEFKIKERPKSPAKPKRKSTRKKGSKSKKKNK